MPATDAEMFTARMDGDDVDLGQGDAPAVVVSVSGGSTVFQFPFRESGRAVLRGDQLAFDDNNVPYAESEAGGSMLVRRASASPSGDGLLIALAGICHVNSRDDHGRSCTATWHLRRAQ